jgi:hypothetical protein
MGTKHAIAEVEKRLQFEHRMVKLHLFWAVKLSRKMKDPCFWGLHKTVCVATTMGKGRVYNGMTGNSYPVPAKASIYICERCKQRSGQMVSACGTVRDFYGSQLEIMMHNAGLRF